VQNSAIGKILSIIGRSLTINYIIDTCKKLTSLIYTFVGLPVVSIESTQPPYLLPSQSSQRVFIGVIMAIRCKAEGKPLPIVKWYIAGIPVHHNSPDHFVSTNYAHSTTYTCEGINYAGGTQRIKTANVTIIVQGTDTIF